MTHFGSRAGGPRGRRVALLRKVTLRSAPVAHGTSHRAHRHQMVRVAAGVAELADRTRVGDVTALLAVVAHQRDWSRALARDVALFGTVETPGRRQHLRTHMRKQNTYVLIRSIVRSSVC